MSNESNDETAKKVIKIHMVEKQLFYAPLYIAVKKYNQTANNKTPNLPQVKLIDSHSTSISEVLKNHYLLDSPNGKEKCILNLLDDLPINNDSLDLILTGDLDIFKYLSAKNTNKEEKRICLWYIFVNRFPILKIKKDFSATRKRKILSPMKGTTLYNYINKLYTHKSDLEFPEENEKISNIPKLLSKSDKCNSAYFTGSVEPLDTISIDGSFQNSPCIIPFSCIVSNDTEYGRSDFRKGLDLFFETLEKSSEELYRLELRFEGGEKNKEYIETRKGYLNTIGKAINDEEDEPDKVSKIDIPTIRKVISEYAQMRIWDFNPMIKPLSPYPKYLERLIIWDVSKKNLDELINRDTSENEQKQEDNKEVKVTQKGNKNVHIFYEPYQRSIDSIEKAKAQALDSAISKIIARNSAHHIESHISHRATLDKIIKRINCKVYSKQLDKISGTFDAEDIVSMIAMENLFTAYKSQRNNFIAGLDSNISPISLRFYQDIILPFCENSLIMDNIAKSEGVCFGEAGKPLNKNDISKLRIRVFYADDIGIQHEKGDSGPFHSCNIPIHPEMTPNTVNSNSSTEKTQHCNIQCGWINIHDKKPADVELTEYDLKLLGDPEHKFHEVCAFYSGIKKNENCTNTKNGKELASLICVHDLPYYKKIIKEQQWYGEKKFNCSDIEIAVPGTLGLHSIYSILENFIRNTAKHANRELLNKAKHLDIIIKISSIENDFDFYNFELTTNIPTLKSNDFKDENSLLFKLIESNKAEINGATTAFGIADMRINAALLKFEAITIKKLEKIITIPKPYEKGTGSESTEEKSNNTLKYKYALRYEFKITKPQKIVFIGERFTNQGFTKDEYKKLGVHAYKKKEDCINSLGKDRRTRAFQFAIVDYTVFENFKEDDLKYKKLASDANTKAKPVDQFLNILPWRVIVTGSKNDSNSQLLDALNTSKRVTYIPDLQFSAIVNNGNEDYEKIVENWLSSCWENWLCNRWGKDKKYNINIYLGQFESDEPTNKYVIKANDFNNIMENSWLNVEIKSNKTYCKAFDASREYIVYDRHGNANYLDIKKEGNAYAPALAKIIKEHHASWYFLGKSNPDFDIIYNDSLMHPAVSFSKLAEAGIHKILIIDERINEIASNVSTIGYPPANNRFWDGKDGKDLILHQCIAGNIFVADSLEVNNEEVLSEKPSKSGGVAYNLQVIVDEKGVNYKGNYGTNINDLNVDTLIIHRTMLDKIITADRSLFTNLSNKFPNIIVCTGGGTLSYDEEIMSRIRKLSFFTLKKLIRDKGIAKYCLTNQMF